MPKQQVFHTALLPAEQQSRNMPESLDEDDLVFIVWSNTSSSQGRPFETMTKHGSRLPVAWSLSNLQSKYLSLYPDTHLIFSEDDLRSWMSPPLSGTIEREKPLLIPVKYAKSVLGWQDYNIWEDETKTL